MELPAQQQLPQSATSSALPAPAARLLPTCCPAHPLQAVVDLVREYNGLGRGNLAIMLDTKGPGGCCAVRCALCALSCVR